MLKNLILATFWLCLEAGQPHPGERLIANDAVWLSQLDWRKKPKGVEGDYAHGVVIQFRREGEVRSAECILLRNRGQISVSEGDGFTRYVGTWSIRDRAIHMRSRIETPTRLLSRPFVVGDFRDLDGTLSEDRLGPKLRLGNRTYCPERTISPESIQFLLDWGSR